MKRLYQASRLAIVLLIVAMFAAVAQEKLTKSPISEKKGAESEISALELRGLELIREAGRDASTLVDRRQAVRIQALAADSLWKHDENTARAFFGQAFENASTYYRDRRDEDVDKLGGASFVPRSDLRLEVIRLASRHDAALAKTFTDQFVAEKRREAESKTAQSNYDRKVAGDPALFGSAAPATADLMMAASSLLNTDHKMAADLAMRAIAGGITQPVPDFLARLSIRDRASADRVFQAALERVAAEPQVVPGQLLLLAAYPFGENRVWISDGNSTSSIGFSRLPKFEVNERQIAGFLRISAVVLTRASQIDTAQSPDLARRFNSALFAARVLEPKVANHDPALLENWRALLSKLQSAAQQKTRDGIDNTLREMTAENQSSQEQSANAPDRVKSMLDAAERTSDLVERDNRFGSAATAAMQGGDFARALEIADRISDMDYRQRVREWINSRAANKAIEEKRIDDALRFAGEVSATDERAYLYYQIANIALGSQDKARALQLAEDAANYVSKAENGLGKLRALIGLAGLYSKVDVARSFELLSEAAKVADRIGDYSPEQARLVRTLSNRNGSNNMVSSTTVEAFDLGKTFAIFAAIDFDRTLGLANAFETKALKHSTVIAVASTLFDRKPAKTGS